jgi:nucleotidyltransferase/DNA polymerase involved in DNA repair
VWWEIVVAATYNAKRKWVKVGTPVWQAREILPKDRTVFTGVNFELYGEISRKLMKYLQENTLKIEKFSIDEAFCEISGLPELYKKSPYQYAQHLQENIKAHIWIPVSIWVSNTRIKAKIFSDLNKPYGIYIGNDGESEYECFQKIAFWNIPFAGKKTQHRFQYRCNSISDFMDMWFWQLKRECWKHMTTLWLELHWVNAFQIDNTAPAKSLSRSRSFNKQKTANKQFLYEQILTHFETVYIWMTEKSIEIQEFWIMLRDENFKTHRLKYTLPEHTNDRQKILLILQALFEELYIPNMVYRSTWVNCYKLRSYLPRQLNLFEKEFQKKDNSYELSRAINKLNHKYGKQKICFWKELINHKNSERIRIMG